MNTPETDNERTLKVALEVFTQLANTLKQERDEARELLAKSIVRGDLALEETKKAKDALHWSDIQDIREMQRERDEARKERDQLKQLLAADSENVDAYLGVCIERDEAREALMKIEDLFIDGTDIYADRENMGIIARNALEGAK